jgi:hypothetical protein
MLDDVQCQVVLENETDATNFFTCMYGWFRTTQLRGSLTARFPMEDGENVRMMLVDTMVLVRCSESPPGGESPSLP